MFFVLPLPGAGEDGFDAAFAMGVSGAFTATLGISVFTTVGVVFPDNPVPVLRAPGGT